MTRKIIIDTDPGVDDAIAILMALASPAELDILGIVAIAGNVGLAKNARNALQLVELSGRTDIPVYAGCERPMKRILVTAEETHGTTGMDGPTLPAPKIQLQDQHGIDFIIDTLRKTDAGTVTLCTLGPLTNIAMALIKAPDIAPRIQEIVMMAGAYFQVGNVTPTAEFNVYVDPDAADIVLRSGVPIVMAPLDLTHKILTTPKRLDAIKALPNKAGQAAGQMLTFYSHYDVEKYGIEGAPLHDPCVIAYLLKPELFKAKPVGIRVETGSELTMGMTVVDYWGNMGWPKNVQYLHSGDADGFYALVTERLGRLP